MPMEDEVKGGVSPPPRYLFAEVHIKSISVSLSELGEGSRESQDQQPGNRYGKCSPRVSQVPGL